jgi:formylglycine-generating enzyme
MGNHVSVTSSTLLSARSDPPSKDMVWIPGGTFVMGSDRHYPEEAPTHLSTVK